MSADRRSLGAVLFLPVFLLLALGAMRDAPVDLEPLEQLYGGPLHAALADLLANNPRAFRVIAESEGLLPSVARMVEATGEWREEHGPGVIVLRFDSWGDRTILARERPRIVVSHSRDPFLANDPMEESLPEYLRSWVTQGYAVRESDDLEKRAIERSPLSVHELGATPDFVDRLLDDPSGSPLTEEEALELLGRVGWAFSRPGHDSSFEGDPADVEEFLTAARRVHETRRRQHDAHWGAIRVFGRTLRLTDRLHPENLPEARARAALFIEWYFDRETPVDPPFTAAELDGLDLGD